MIILHDTKEHEYNTNGIGVLDHDILGVPVVHWEMNGEYSFTFKYASNGLHIKELLAGRQVEIRSEDHSNVFIIENVDKRLDHTEVFCEQKSILLVDNFVTYASGKGISPKTAIDNINANMAYPHGFVINTEQTGEGSIDMKNKNGLAAFLDEQDTGSYISNFGGEVYRFYDRIVFYSKIGKDRNVEIRYSKDLLGYTATIDTRTVCTRIYPVGANGLTLPEKYVDSPNIDPDHPIIRVVEFSDVQAFTEADRKQAINAKNSEESKTIREEQRKLTEAEKEKAKRENRKPNKIDTRKVTFVREEVTDGDREKFAENLDPSLLEYMKNDNAVPVEEAYAKLRELARKEFTDNRIDEPSYTYDVDFVVLEKTKEYEQFKNLHTILGGDTVRVVHTQNDLDVSARCIEYDYNPLTQKYITMKLGKFDNSLSKQMSASVNTAIARAKAQAIEEAEQKAQIRIQQAANGKNVVVYSDVEPVGDFIDGDIWYKPIGDGDVEMYVYDGGWPVEPNMSTVKTERALQAAQGAIEKADQVRNDIDKSIAEAGFGNLTEAIAEVRDSSERLVTAEEDLKKQGLLIQKNKDSLVTATTAINDLKNTTDLHTSEIAQLPEKIQSTVLSRVQKSINELKEGPENYLADSWKSLSQSGEYGNVFVASWSLTENGQLLTNEDIVTLSVGVTSPQDVVVNGSITTCDKAIQYSSIDTYDYPVPGQKYHVIKHTFRWQQSTNIVNSIIQQFQIEGAWEGVFTIHWATLVKGSDGTDNWTTTQDGIESVIDKIHKATVDNLTQMIQTDMSIKSLVEESTTLPDGTKVVDKMTSVEQKANGIEQIVYGPDGSNIRTDLADITRHMITKGELEAKQYVTADTVSTMLKNAQTDSQSQITQTATDILMTVKNNDGESIFYQDYRGIHMNRGVIDTAEIGHIDAGTANIINIDNKNMTSDRIGFMEAMSSDENSMLRLAPGKIWIGRYDDGYNMYTTGGSWTFAERGNVMGYLTGSTNASTGTADGLGLSADRNNTVFLGFSEDDGKHSQFYLYGRNGELKLERLNALRFGPPKTEGGEPRIVMTEDKHLSMSTNGYIKLISGDTVSLDMDTTRVYCHKILSMEGNRITNQSDIRLKADIRPWDVSALEVLKNTEFITFHWKEGVFENVDTTTKEYGVAAQSIPFGTIKDEDGYLSVDIQRLIYLSLRGVRELDEKVGILENKVSEAENKVLKIENENKALQRENESLQSTIKSIEERLSALERSISTP